MEKNDFIRISATNSMTVTSRQESSKHEYDQKKKKGQKRGFDDKEESIIEEFEIFELIEYGKILFTKRNKELRLFMKMYQESEEFGMRSSECGDDNNVVTGLAPDADDLDVASYVPTDDEEKVEEFDPMVLNLSKLLEHYNTFFALVKDENRILNIDDIDFLEDIIKQKEDTLNLITSARDAVVFDYFKDLSPEDKNKIKANEILSDIHIVIDEIIRQEDENSVELQNIREKMKLDIAKQDRGAKAVLQYAQSTTKSHFIDTKK